MSTPTWGLDPKSRRITVYYTGTGTIREGMPLCYNYLSTDNWLGVASIDFTSTASTITESGTTAEGGLNEGKFIHVCKPIVIDVEGMTSTSGSATLTCYVVNGTYDAEEFNDIKVNQWVTITGTGVTNGTYKVTAVTQGEDGVTKGTMTLDMPDATATVLDVRVVVNNTVWHAGVVAGADHDGEVGPKALDIYIPNGAIVPVRTDKDCTIGESLGLGIDVYSAATGDDDPLPCAVCMETVDRSSASGLVLAKVFETSNLQQYFQPVRGKAGSYVYGVQVDGTKILRGTAASKSYVMQISADRESGYAATGDSNDALLKIQGSNYALNDSNYILRGINVALANRGAGTLGHIFGGNISISLKSGSGNITNAIALQVDAQDLTSGTKTEFGGLDIAINREGTAATTEYGMQIRTRGTVNTAITSAIRIAKDAADHGFVNLFDIETDGVDYVSCTGTMTVTTADYAIPILLNDVTHYIIAVDGIPAG